MLASGEGAAVTLTTIATMRTRKRIAKLVKVLLVQLADGCFYLKACGEEVGALEIVALWARGCVGRLGIPM